MTFVYEMVKKKCLSVSPKAHMTSSNVLFCPQPKVLSQRRKETRKYSHLSWNQRILTVFSIKNDLLSSGQYKKANDILSTLKRYFFSLVFDRTSIVAVFPKMCHCHLLKQRQLPEMTNVQCYFDVTFQDWAIQSKSSVTVYVNLYYYQQQYISPYSNRSVNLINKWFKGALCYF